MSVKTTLSLQRLGDRYAIPTLLLFHIIGLGIFLYPDRPLGLSGFNMILCAAMVFITSEDYRREWMGLMGICIGGFVVEAIGVNTGLLFGVYEYGNELGWKVLGVPVVLGFNWYCVVALGGHLVRVLAWQWSLGLKAVLAGAVATALDFMIEPVAMYYDFWDWEGNIIPIFNYVCWWGFASIFATGYLYLVPGNNRTALALLGIWITFFGLLNIVIGLA